VALDGVAGACAGFAEYLELNIDKAILSTPVTASPAQVRPN
jgi:hypothetical protein